MRHETVSLEVTSAATGTGAPRDVRELMDKWVQVEGLNGDTVLIEGTISGSKWETALTFTADGVKELPEAWTQIRTNKTVDGAGATIVATLGARNARTD